MKSPIYNFRIRFKIYSLKILILDIKQLKNCNIRGWIFIEFLDLTSFYGYRSKYWNMAGYRNNDGIINSTLLKLNNVNWCFIDSIVPEVISLDCKLLRVSLASSLGVEFHSYRRLLLYFPWVVETGAKT